MHSRKFRLPACLILFLWLGCLSPLIAHPLPDIPVRATFEKGGKCSIQIEVDPRCFEADPNSAPSLLNESLQKMPETERTKLRDQARVYAQKTVAFYFQPLGQITPEWAFDFTTHAAQPLKNADDVVVITGFWNTTVPTGIQGYRIRALKGGNLSVLFLNTLFGEEVKRVSVLFPGEESFLLNISEANADLPTTPLEGTVGAGDTNKAGWATFVQFMRQGFVHVLPLGLDHILFVLGLFLLSRQWRPLLWQVTTFTLAHTITLGLATLGWVHVSSNIVEPIIAASIAAVAIENIVHPRYTPWRLLLVFAFGLIHGLGFAGALQALDIPTSSLLIGLVGFNVGVEGGQLAIITIAFALTFWIREPVAYRRFIVIPGSVIIALMGLWWTLERVGLIPS